VDGGLFMVLVTKKNWDTSPLYYKFVLTYDIPDFILQTQNLEKVLVLLFDSKLDVLFFFSLDLLPFKL